MTDTGDREEAAALMRFPAQNVLSVESKRAVREQWERYEAAVWPIYSRAIRVWRTDRKDSHD